MSEIIIDNVKTTITNLINKDAVTITNCESEPIHIPGSIQPHGFLLGVTGKDLKITYCSENCTSFFDLPVSEILGSALSRFFNDKEISAFTIYYKTTGDQLARPFIFTCQGHSYNTTAHQSKNCVLLEFESFSRELNELPDIYIQTKRFAYHTERADNLQMLCQDIAAEVKQITGYDRVMIYRFDENYNGEVFAESKADVLQPFLGLHYPHTDIPAQARELFMLNKVRMLVDVNYTPIPIYGLGEDNVTVENLDLSLASLRSFSPIHIRYLQNMGVGATFNISLVHNKKLWGLISCHHYAPKHIPYYTRLAADLQAVFLSSQIDVRQVADEFELTRITDIKINTLQDDLTKAEANILDQDNLQQVKNLLNADGVVLHHNGQIFSEGLLPATDSITTLLQWLSHHHGNTKFSTSTLISHYPAAAGISDFIAGIYYLPLGQHTNDCLLWTIAEIEKTINWAGDPDKAIVKNDETKELTPRKSFDLWKQKVKYQSRYWRKAEINAAALICFNIQHHLHIDELKQEELRYIDINDKLQKANDELANMNWISTHDLKEPLRKIQMYASIILEKDSADVPDTVKKTIGRMQASANRMQLLVDDLLSYTKVMNDDSRFASIDLNTIIAEVETELKEALQEKNGTINTTLLPNIKGVHFQLRQLFINLISNSIKFSKAGEPPIITITCKKDAGGEITGKNVMKTYYCITVADNGIGFNSIYKNDIFKVFNRLHSKQYKGTGIGLAICKKITEINHGFIDVGHSEEGNGASFNLYFPVAE